MFKHLTNNTRNFQAGPPAGGGAGPAWTTLDLSTATQVDFAGKINLGASTLGTTSTVALSGYTGGTSGRNMPFFYIELFDAAGADHIDVATSLEVVIEHAGAPTSSLVTAAYVGLISNTTLASGPGFFCGPEWNSGRTVGRVSQGGLGNVDSDGGGTVAANINKVWCNWSFSQTGVCQSGVFAKSASQLNIRSFQVHNDAMKLAVAFSNGGNTPVWSGLKINYRLNAPFA